MKSPLITRYAHEAILHERDQRELALHRENAALRTLLHEERERASKFANQLVEMAKPPQPVLVDRKGRTVGGDEPRPLPETIDLAEVDPDDTESIMLILRNEAPAGMVRANGVQLQRSIERLRQQIKEAKIARNSPGVPLGPPPGVLSAIDQAISQGQADARKAS